MSYGVDIGSTAVKVVALRRTLGGYRVTGAARKRVTRAAAQEKTALLKLLYEALGPRNGQRAGVVGLSGRDINLQLVQQPAMKPLNYRIMMGYELDQRKGQATDMYLDYCTLREPDPFFPQYLALIGIGKSAYVDERIDLASKANIDVRDAVPNSFALYAAYKSAYETEGGTVLLLDLGSDNMDLAFVRGGRLIFARNVSSGARVFDNQIANMLGAGVEEAEALKVTRGNLGPATHPEDEEKEEELRAPIRSAAGQLAGFVTSSINHAKTQLNDRELTIDKVYLSGGGSRVRGLPEYLTGALKIPVEILDPFQKLDTSAVDRQGGEAFRSLPTDMAIAIGLAQLVSPSPGTAASTLSILPDALKKRRNYFRTGLWLGIAGGAMLASMLILTGLAFWRKISQQSNLENFIARTGEVKKRIDDMDALERDQRELAAKTDYLLSHVTGGRVVLDTVTRLKRARPPQMALGELRMADPGAKRGERGEGSDRQRAAFTVRRRGLVIGEIESETDQEIRLRGQPEPFRDEDIVDGIKGGGVLRWPALNRAMILSGEIDETIPRGAREALNTLREQLSDASRGVKAVIQNQKASSKAGWRQFEILITFE